MPIVPAGVLILYAEEFDPPLIQRKLPFAALIVRSLNELLSSKTNLSIVTDEFPPTANLVPSLNRNSPNPSLEVRMRSSRWTGECVARVPPSPVTVVLMRTASPTFSAACVQPAASDKATEANTLKRKICIEHAPKRSPRASKRGRKISSYHRKQNTTTDDNATLTKRRSPPLLGKR